MTPAETGPATAQGRERKADSVDTGQRPRAVGAQVVAERGDVPRPQQPALDETVEARRGRVLLRARRAHHGIGLEVDARAVDGAEVELAHAAGVDERDLDLEVAARGAQGL